MSRVLRMLRSRQNVFHLGRSVNGSISSASAPGVARIQHVKFVKRQLSVRNIVGGALLSYLCYDVYCRVIMRPLGNALADLPEGEDDDDDDDDEDIDDTLSVTLPFTTRLVFDPPYKGTDPEWQAYLTVSKDPKMRSRLEAETCNIVKRLLETSTIITSRYGKEMRINRQLLSIIYPSSPPPTIMRKILYMDSSTWGVAEKPIESHVHNRIMRTLYPSALTMSLWTFSGALMQQNMNAVARFFGYDAPDTSKQSLDLFAQKMNQQMKALGAAKPPPAIPGASGSVQNPQTSAASADNQMSRATTDSAASTESAPSSPTEPTKTSIPRPLPSTGPGGESIDDKMINAKDLYVIKMTQEHTQGPWQKFKKALAAKWIILPPMPARGAILVQGWVTVEAPQAYISCETSLWYDPTKKAFDMRASRVKVRVVNPKKQRPLGK